MNYAEVEVSKLKDLHKVIGNYDINIIKVHGYLTKQNPEVKDVKGQFYLTDCSLVNNIVNL